MSMRKFGKYEKMPDGTQEKQQPAKSMLLRTYFTSLLSLVLCVTMFFGTSYAWFTSEVSNTANEIYVGTLKVGLYKDGADLANSSEKLFDGSIRWEPGYTALETIEVVNKGNLAFNYVLNFTDGTGVDTNTLSMEKVAEHFEVWVYNHYKNKQEPNPSDYGSINTENGWDYAGSLDELLAGEAVLEGVMTTVLSGGNVVETTDRYTIALHMKNDATAEVMGHRISLTVKLVAYQMSKETDAFGNGNYDQFEVVTTVEDLQKALQNGGSVVLAEDMDLSETQLTIPSGVNAELHLNGHKLTGTVQNQVSLITNKGNLTISGPGNIAMNYTGTPSTNAAVNTISNRGVLTVNGGNISNTGTGDQIGYAIDNYNGAVLTVNGGKITASGSNYYDGIRLFCGNNETLVTVNGGEVSSIWAQNPSAGKETEVKGTVVINGGEITKTYYENYTVVKVAEGVTADVEAYGSFSENASSSAADGYTVYRFN